MPHESESESESETNRESSDLVVSEYHSQNHESRIKNQESPIRNQSRIDGQPNPSTAQSSRLAQTHSHHPLPLPLPLSLLALALALPIPSLLHPPAL